MSLLLVTALLTTMLATALTACTPGSSAARTVAERYLGLIAAADAAHLEELWALTAIDDPGALRAAGELLPGAADRIEVLEIGDATQHRDESPVALPTYPNFDAEKAVRVSVRYRLAGTEHDAVVALAPLQHRPTRDPDSWRVVQPLLGSLGFPPQSTGLASGSDVYVSGIRVMANTDDGAGPLDTAYPGVYEVQLRADPYLVSKTASVTVAPNARNDIPDMALNGTPMARQHLRAKVLSMFTRCEADVDECPAGVTQLSRDLSRSDWNVDSWKFNLTSPPTRWTVSASEGRKVVRYAGGRFTLSYTDGTRRTVRFNATTDWRFESSPPVPQLGRTTIEVIP